MNTVNFEDGHCKRIRAYLDSYLNNETIVETNHAVLRHLEACEECSRSLEDRARLKAQLKRAVMLEYAPAALRERIASDLRGGRGFSFSRLYLALAAAAAVLVIAAATSLVKERMPREYTVAVGHRCHYQGREFIHLIMRNQNDVVSLVITRRNGDAFPTDGVAAIAQAAGGPIYHASWANQRVAGLETRNHLVFVISNDTSDANLQIAASLAPSVRAFLARLES